MASSSSTALIPSATTTKPSGPGMGESLPFDDLCQCFEALNQPVQDRHSKPRKMTKLWEKYGIKHHPLYPLMRLTLPALDNNRPNYRLKQKGLARMYVDILAISEQSAVAQTMLNWKRPNAGYQRNEQGNFPEVAYSAIQGRTKNRRDLPAYLSVGELNVLLDRLANADTTESKTEVMRDIINKTTAREQRWILRIIIKDMHIGMKEQSVFSLLHPDAQELYNTVCDLKDTCERCVDSSYRLHGIGITLFRPLKPKLATRGTWTDMHKKLGKHGEYVAEDKLDGERLMLHFKRGGGPDGGDRTQWLTRNCNDFSHGYCEAMGTVLEKCFKPGLQEVILDGEMMVWNRKEGQFSAFGDNRGLFDYKKRLDNETQPCYCVFDCLWVNGVDLCKLDLYERRARASEFIEWAEHSIELTKQHVIQPYPNRPGTPTTTHTQEIMESLDAAMARGVEGVMFKSVKVPYAPGARDETWMKLKPDYVPDMGDELDVLIIAGYYGEGKKRGGDISHFLLGVKAPASEKFKHPDVQHPHFYPFAKVGTGYTQARLAELREQLKPGQHKWHKHQRPRHLCGWVPNKTDDEPDVWFEPAQSVVIAIKAYEIVPDSKAFLPCGYTLRFPRLARFREDKSYTDVETFEEVQRRCEEGKAKISMSKRSAADVMRANPSDLRYGGVGGKGKKKEGGGAVVRQVGVLSHMRVDTAALSATKVETDILEGAVVVVRGYGATDPSSNRTKANLQQLVKKLGGQVHANPTALTRLIVSADEDPGPEVLADIDAARRKAAEDYDIVKASWLLACEEAGAKLPLEPRFVLYASPESDSKIQSCMDEWGDPYREEATSKSLAHSMDLVRTSQQKQAQTVAQPPPPSDQLVVVPPPQKRLKTEPAAAATAANAASGAGDGAKPGGPSAATLAKEAIIQRSLKELNDIDVRRVCSGGPLNALLGLTAFSPRAATRIRLRLLGASVVSVPTAQVSHAVLPSSSITDGSCARVRAALREARMSEAASGGGAGFYAYIVGEDWLAACETTGTKVAETSYALLEGAPRASADEAVKMEVS